MEVDALYVKIIEEMVNGEMDDDAKDAEEKSGGAEGRLQGRPIVKEGACRPWLLAICHPLIRRASLPRRPT